jgi:hypothetical protein
LSVLAALHNTCSAGAAVVDAGLESASCVCGVLWR